MVCSREEVVLWIALHSAQVLSLREASEASKALKHFSCAQRRSYVAAAYVKWVEMAGARAVPIRHACTTPFSSALSCTSTTFQNWFVEYALTENVAGMQAEALKPVQSVIF